MSVRCETNSSRGSNWLPFCSTSQNESPSRITGRNDFGERDATPSGTTPRYLFIAVAIAIVAGLLFPQSVHILDVLLVFSVSLTAAVLIITFSAHGASDVSGFPLLIVLTTMLRMALSVASTKLIFSQGNAGTIIGLFGQLIVRNNAMLATLVFSVLMVVIFGIICKAAKDISRTASKFTSDIVPIRQISIDSDLNASVINKSQAFDLREKIARESSFFAAMGGAARFILCDAIIELVIAIINMVGGMATGAISGRPGMSVEIYATLGVGAGMMSHIPALLAAAASAYLVRRSFLPLSTNDGFAEEEVVERIEVAANDVMPSRTAALQYENAVTTSQAGTPESQYIGNDPAKPLQKQGPAANANVETEKIVSEDLECFDVSRYLWVVNEKVGLNLWVWEEIKDSDCYDAIAELIESKSDNKAKTILMAAANVEELPVTVPVNIAMRLAQRERRCLLIDLDLERGAISKVFDVDSESPAGDRIQPGAIATCIDNLWVWPAGNFVKVDGEPEAINIKEVITSLESQYEHLIVYAPNIKLLANSDRPANCVQAAMLFGGPGAEGKSESCSISELYKLLISYGCEIFKPTEAFAEAV